MNRAQYTYAQKQKAKRRGECKQREVKCDFDFDCSKLLTDQGP